MVQKFSMYRTITLLLGFILVFTAYAEDSDQYPKKNKVGRIPAPPPLLPKFPCPKIPPGVEVVDHCYEDLKNRYLQTEGQHNRGENFYYLAHEFFSRNSYEVEGVHQVGYSAGINVMFDVLGLPDYQTSRKVGNDDMQLYAYKYNSNSLLVVHTAYGYIYRVTFRKNISTVKETWRKFESSSQ